MIELTRTCKPERYTFVHPFENNSENENTKKWRSKNKEKKKRTNSFSFVLHQHFFQRNNIVRRCFQPSFVHLAVGITLSIEDGEIQKKENPV